MHYGKMMIIFYGIKNYIYEHAYIINLMPQIRKDRQMKKYKKVLTLIFSLLILIILTTAGPSFAFRCGTSVISAGDTKHRVLQQCGEPDYIDSWEEVRILKNYGSTLGFDPRTRPYGEYREPILVKEYVTIDVWTYNRGSARFIRYLTFEKGILKEINTGDRGY
jgi:hypothetical protein